MPASQVRTALKAARPRLMWLLRILLTAGLLGVAVYVARPANIVRTVRGCRPALLLAAAALSPLFLLGRIRKWHIVLRQVYPGLGFVQIAPDYLLGMGIGLVTPGRVGEMARLKHGAINKGVGLYLFVVEKAVEIAALVIIASAGGLVLGALQPWASALLATAAVGGVIILQRFMPLFHDRVVARLVRAVSGRESVAVPRIGIMGCFLLSVLVMVVYSLQAYLIAASMHDSIGAREVGIFPVVLLGNLVPITIGGFGMREVLSAYLFRLSSLPPEVGVSAMFAVGLFDLVIPGILGLLLNGFGCFAGTGGASIEHPPIA